MATTQLPFVNPNPASLQGQSPSSHQLVVDQQIGGSSVEQVASLSFGVAERILTDVVLPDVNEIDESSFGSSSRGSLISHGPPSGLSVNVPVSSIQFPAFEALGIDQVQMRVTEKPEDEVLMRMQEVQSKYVLFNRYGNNNGHYFELKQDDHQKIAEAFTSIRAFCAREPQGSRLHVPDNATQFSIQWSMNCVSFFDPSIGHTRVIDLNEIKEASQDVNDKVEAAEHAIREINGGPIRNQTYHRAYKGPTDGGIPLHRGSNPILISLPEGKGVESYERAMNLAEGHHADDAAKNKALIRMAAAEKMIHGTLEFIKKRKQTIEADIEGLELRTSTLTPKEQQELEEKRLQLRDLTIKYRQWTTVDTYALYAALAFYPIDADAPNIADQVKQSAEALNQAVNLDIQKLCNQEIEKGTTRDWPVIGGWTKSVPAIEHPSHYVNDITPFAGLESPAEARIGYVEYCRSKGIHAKNDSSVDGLLRAVVLQQEDVDNNAILEHIYDDVKDVQIKQELKAQLIADLRAAKALQNAEVGASSSGLIDVVDLRQRNGITD